MQEKKFLENDDQFVISYELLYILHWILKHEKQTLKDLVSQAYAKGVQAKKQQRDLVSELQSSEEMQQSIVDFFSILEEHVAHISEASTMQTIMHTNVVKTLAHIDPKSFDDSIIQSSMAATAEKVETSNKTNIKEQLLKELLKQWQPQQTKSNKESISH